jgi:predicted ATPase
MHLTSATVCSQDFPTRTRYPFNLDLLQRLGRITFRTPVTLFVGENGTGKSTLLRAICQRAGIHIWQEAEGRRCENNPFEHSLHLHLGLEWADGKVPGAYFGSDTFRYFTQALDEWASTDPGQLKYFGGSSLVTKSHGQSLMAYFRSRYKVRGLYLLDEPETALSPRSQLELLDLLVRMGSAGHAQFIVATHSPILLACPGAVLYSFDRSPLRQVRYEETEHYRIYRDFMQDPAGCLRTG